MTSETVSRDDAGFFPNRDVIPMHEGDREHPPPEQPTVRSARQLLGVAAEADASELTRAYWRQARRLHPDLSSDPEATEQFRALHAAYRLALLAAPDAGSSRPSPPLRPPSPGPLTPTSAGQPGPPRGRPGWGASVSAAASPDNGVWVVAGPVHVHTATRPCQGNHPREGRP
jgi:DnaJ-like protein